MPLNEDAVFGTQHLPLVTLLGMGEDGHFASIFPDVPERDILLDARSKERYQGINDPVDPIAGHVPGAISHPLGTNLDKTAKFRRKEDLQHNFNKISNDMKDKEIISMCGSGITACHNILALEIIGIRDVKLYVGSWSEWITDANRPIVTIKSN